MDVRQIAYNRYKAQVIPCRHCGEPGTPSDRALCCLMADGEERTPAWCLWCGEDLPDGRSFCDKRCSVEYHENLANRILLVRGIGTA